MTSFLLATCLAFAPQEASDEDPLFDQVVAVVNDQILTLRQLEQAARLATAPHAPTDADRQRTMASALLDMLYREGFRLDGGNEAMLDALVEDEMQRRAKKSPSTAAAISSLAATGSTWDQERQRLRLYFASILFRQIEFGYRPTKDKQFKTQLYASPGEALAWYEAHPEDFQHEHRVSARLILLRNEPDSSPAQERLTALRQQILSGEQGFADLARALSLYRRTTGGATGHIQPDSPSLQEPIRAFLTTAKAGDLSDPIQLANGNWALVTVEEVQEAGTTPFSEVQLAITASLREEQSRKIMAETVNRLRSRCYVRGPGVERILDILFPPAEEEAEL